MEKSMEKLPEHYMFITKSKTAMYDYQPDNVDGWVVDGELMAKITQHYPNFVFVLDADGNLVDVTPTAPPEPVPRSPTIDERLTEIESATLDNTEMQVDLDYRLTCLALDITGGDKE